MTKNAILMIVGGLIVSVLTLVVESMLTEMRSPANDIRITHRMFSLPKNVLEKILEEKQIVENGSAKEYKYNENIYDHVLEALNLPKASYTWGLDFHHYIIDADSSRIYKNIKVDFKDFGQIVVVIDKEVQIYKTQNMIDLNIFPNNKIEIFAAKAGELHLLRSGSLSDKVHFSFNDKIINIEHLWLNRDYELNPLIYWHLNNPFLSFMVVALAIIAIIISLIAIIINLVFISNPGGFAKFLSDKDIVKYYFVYRNIRKNNPKRLREIIKIIRRSNPV